MFFYIYIKKKMKQWEKIHIKLEGKKKRTKSLNELEII